MFIIPDKKRDGSFVMLIGMSCMWTDTVFVLSGQWLKKCLCQVTFMSEDCYACVFTTPSLPARHCLHLKTGRRYLSCLHLPIRWWETESRKRKTYSWNMNKWLHCFSCVINTSKRPSENYYSFKECHCIEGLWLRIGVSVIQSASPRVLQTEMQLSTFFSSQKSTTGT